MFVWVAMTVVMVGWDYQGDRQPPRHRHLFAWSEFHKTCAGIVDDIGGGKSFAARQSKTIPARSLSGRSGGNIFALQYRTRSLPETAHNPRNRVNQSERNQE
jgi:hypothetical protein